IELFELPAHSKPFTASSPNDERTAASEASIVYRAPNGHAVADKQIRRPFLRKQLNNGRSSALIPLDANGSSSDKAYIENRANGAISERTFRKHILKRERTSRKKLRAVPVKPNALKIIPPPSLNATTNFTENNSQQSNVESKNESESLTTLNSQTLASSDTTVAETLTTDEPTTIKFSESRNINRNAHQRVNRNTYSVPFIDFTHSETIASVTDTTTSGPFNGEATTRPVRRRVIVGRGRSGGPGFVRRFRYPTTSTTAFFDETTIATTIAPSDQTPNTLPLDFPSTYNEISLPTQSQSQTTTSPKIEEQPSSNQIFKRQPLSRGRSGGPVRLTASSQRRNLRPSLKNETYDFVEIVTPRAPRVPSNYRLPSAAQPRVSARTTTTTTTSLPELLDDDINANVRTDVEHYPDTFARQILPQPVSVPVPVARRRYQRPVENVNNATSSTFSDAATPRIASGPRVNYFHFSIATPPPTTPTPVSHNRDSTLNFDRPSRPPPVRPRSRGRQHASRTPQIGNNNGRNDLTAVEPTRLAPGPSPRPNNRVRTRPRPQVERIPENVINETNDENIPFEIVTPKSPPLPSNYLRFSIATPPPTTTASPPLRPERSRPSDQPVSYEFSDFDIEPTPQPVLIQRPPPLRERPSDQRRANRPQSTTSLNTRARRPIRPIIEVSNKSREIETGDFDPKAEINALPNVPGKPGEDFPIYSHIPQTNFVCNDMQFPGFYADMETGCQVYHSCHHKRGLVHSFLCPNGTIFSQEYLICDWWYNVKCGQSDRYYNLNKEAFSTEFASKRTNFTES
ncbi:hypothetical protein B4U79_04911, partial [Dinothrombium tinctorium]